MKNNPDESNEAYHADTDFVSASMLKTLRRSARIFEAEYVTGTMPQKIRKHFQIGSAVHCAALEPWRFDTEYVLIPPDCSDRRTKKYKEWAASVPPGMTALSVEEASDIACCVASLRANPLICSALDADGEIEQSYRWNCKETSVACKMRPDKVCPAQKLILDIKTIDSLSDFAFANHVVDFGYYVQEAHYVNGAAHKYDTQYLSDWTFAFAVVETSCPYRSRLYQLSSELRGVGLDHRKELLQDYSLRLSRNDWSDRDEHELHEIELTKYLRTKIER